MTRPGLVLASASPRRVELLAAIGVVPEVRPAAVDETPRPGEAGADLVIRLAGEKALAVACPDEVVLGADTAVLVDGDVLGKPADDGDARSMLRRLSGRAHEVVTGVAVVSDAGSFTQVARTVVWFRSLVEGDLEWYLTIGESADKAGGYGIQGAASIFVDRIEGSYTNVVGLPVATVDDL